MLKILGLGNSFSWDATTYLDRVAGDLYVRNLHIGGCSLEGHVDKIQNKKAWYEFQAQGVKIGEKTVSANDIIASEDWDYITVQQVSHYSGMYETYEPYLTEVLDFIRKTCPKAKIIWHQTWSYATTSDHPGFANYDHDQELMWSKIEECSHRAVKEHNLDGILEVGKAIQTLRRTLTPDGTDFCRDGFHLSYDYGRYAAAYVWAKFFSHDITDFVPEGADPARITEIRRVIDEMK